MKIKLILTLLIIVFGINVFTQNLVIIYEGDEITSGDTIQITGNETDNELVVNLDVKNSSAVPIRTTVTRYLISQLDEHQSSFCWSNQCYQPSTVTAPSTVDIEPGTTWENDFSGHLMPQGTIGTSIIAYTFFDVYYPNDSAQVIVKYIAGDMSLGESDLDEINVSIYPNPTRNTINFNINSHINEIKTYELLSITGITVRKEISLQNSVKIDVSGLAEGLYIYRIRTDKDSIKTGRIIIQK